MTPVAQILDENDRLKDEVKVLSLRVKSLEKELYGSRSDKRPAEDPNQGKLDGIEESVSEWEVENKATQTARAKPERKGKKKGPKPLNPDLLRVDEQIADPDLKELVCPVTGKLMRVGFTESIEVLARKPAQYFVRRISRNVHVSPVGDCVRYSPWPADVLPRSRIDVSVIANILTSRFADHQPYHRQSQQFDRQGVSLAGNTLVSVAFPRSQVLRTLSAGHICGATSLKPQRTIAIRLINISISLIDFSAANGSPVDTD